MPERYTRGFPFDLGSMEQCASGEWMRTDEVQKQIAELQGEIEGLRHDISVKAGVIRMLDDDCRQQIKTIRKLEVDREASWFIDILAFVVGLGLGMIFGWLL